MSIISAGTTTTTALSSTGNTDGTLQFQVNGTTPSVTLNTLGAIGVGSSPSYGSSGQVLVSAGSTAAPTWTTNVSSQWTTTGSNIYYKTGNVGVGTASPGAKLEVDRSTTASASATGSTTRANSAISVAAGVDTNTRLMFGIDTNTNGWIQTQNTSSSGTASIILNPVGGNLGLGVTLRAWGRSWKGCQIGA